MRGGGGRGRAWSRQPLVLPQSLSSEAIERKGRCGSALVLLFGYLLHPLHGFAVEHFLHGEVGHGDLG